MCKTTWSGIENLIMLIEDWSNSVFFVDVAGKRNHGEEKEEPNKQFQVYTYYTYRVGVTQNYSLCVCCPF